MLTTVDLSSTASSQTLSSPKLLIGLLGPFRVTSGAQTLPFQEESKTALLICYLALAPGRRMSKDALLERLWQEKPPDKASPCLNSLCYTLNKTVKQWANVDGLVHFRGGAYHLSLGEDVQLDIDCFDHWIQEGLRQVAEGRLVQGMNLFESAIRIYRGDLCFVDTMQALIERERLRIMLLNTLAYLANAHYRQQRHLQAQLYALRLLSYDPCREDMHRLIMRSFADLGQRSQALRQYQICRRLLVREFDMEPEEATHRLYEQIRSNGYASRESAHEG